MPKECIEPFYPRFGIMAIMLIRQLINYLFFTYMVMIAIRIIASWFPATQRSEWLYWIARLTDPYLNIFRRLIPPIGGVLDLSPMLAYIGLQLLQYLILRLLG
jgi:YggT family protein